MDGDSRSDAIFWCSLLRALKAFQKILVEYIGSRSRRAYKLIIESYPLGCSSANFQLRSKTADSPEACDPAAEHRIGGRTHGDVVALGDQCVAVFDHAVQPDHEVAIAQRRAVGRKLQMHVGIDQARIDHGVGRRADDPCVGILCGEGIGGTEREDRRIKSDRPAADESFGGIDVVGYEDRGGHI